MRRLRRLRQGKTQNQTQKGAGTIISLIKHKLNQELTIEVEKGRKYIGNYNNVYIRGRKEG